MLEDSASGQLLVRYGYLAILAGTMLEGETVVLVAGFLAHQGYLSIPLIIFFAIAGSTVSDQGLFFLSRVKGIKFLARFPKIATKVTAMTEKMRERPMALTFLALFFRFLYGLRNVTPLFLGVSGIPSIRFVVLNAIGAIIWAVSFCFIGYFFSATLTAVMGTLARYEVLLAIGIILFGSLFTAYRHWKR